MSAERPAMPPAFENWRQFALFVSFLGLFLVLPLVPKPAWMNRPLLYLSRNETDTHKEVNWVVHNVLKGREDIDVLFLGPSHLGCAIHPFVFKRLFRES